MNNLNVASTGYPGTMESWAFLNEMTKDLATIIGRMIHRDDAVIITGVNVSGGDVSDGYISYGGEVFRFIGGAKTDTVVLVEEIVNAEYNTDPANSGQLESLPTYYRRYAKCGNPGEGFKDINFDDFTRMDELIGVVERTKQATENRKGIAEIATQAETNTGTDDEKIVTPKKLAARTATESRKGVAEIATQAETNAGTDDEKIVTPKKLATFWATGIEKQIVEIDSTGETEITLNTPMPNTDYIIVGSMYNDNGANLIYNISDKFNDKFRIYVERRDGTVGVTQSKFEFMVMKL